MAPQSRKITHLHQEYSDLVNGREARTWVLEVGDTSRFRSIKQAISYCGLRGAEKSSGTLSVARKMVVHMLAVDRRETDFMAAGEFKAFFLDK